MSGAVRRMGCSLIAVAAVACGGDDSEMNGMGQGGTSAAPTVTFTKDIHPIFQMKCGKSGCHDMPNLFMPGHGAADVDLAYESVTSVGSVGEPIYDRILVRISATKASDIMPPVYDGVCQGALGAPGCVTQEEYDLIKQWVDEGHPK
jgi:hypothetical protein